LGIAVLPLLDRESEGIGLRASALLSALAGSAYAALARLGLGRIASTLARQFSITPVTLT